MQKKHRWVKIGGILIWIGGGVCTYLSFTGQLPDGWIMGLASIPCGVILFFAEEAADAIARLYGM